VSRTIGGALVSHLATRTHTRCYMLRLDLTDGTSIGITDHDRDLDFDLGDGEITYSASTGILPSDVTLQTGLDADNYEVSGPIGDTVTLAALLGGRFNRATARLFMVNWKSLGSGAIPIMKGWVSEARPEGGKFVFEIRSAADKLNQVIGRVTSPFCPGDHAECCVNIADEVATTVSGVVNDRAFTVAAAITAADFVGGLVTFTGGGLAGTLPIEIFAVSGSTLTLFTALSDLPEIGDAVTIKEGCDRTRATCVSRFANAAWFRGLPDMPGTDQVMKYQVPGNAGA
jgi:uncharacterized phage protein (TIGR02218 family)